MEDQLILYTYWRSSCSWRVRLALEYKNIPYKSEFVHLLGNQQNSESYSKLNPFHQIPCLVIPKLGASLTQSVAIMEYLDESLDTELDLSQLSLDAQTKASRKFLCYPGTALQRAHIRSIVECINSGIQPLQNLSVLNKVSDLPDKRNEWAKFWIEKGLVALEAIVASTCGLYCVGDLISAADFCLLPQLYNARRFNVDMNLFPTLVLIESRLVTLDFVIRAHPDSQLDANVPWNPPSST